MVVGKARETLHDLFKTGAKPTGSDFQALIDSALNSNDDGIEKPLGADTPLKILARGDTENVLDFYTGDTHTWRVNQKPVGAPNSGLSFESGNTSKLFIDSGSGNVGIGTASPSSKLTVNGDIAASGMLKIESVSPTLRFVDSTESNPDRYSGWFIHSDHTKLHFFPRYGNFNSLTLLGNGNVGIGATDPSAKLEVNGGITTGGLKIQSGSPQIDFVDGDNKDWSIHVNSDKMYFIREGWHLDSLILNGDGNVGIGTATPSSKLEVAGKVTAQGLTVSGNHGESDAGISHTGMLAIKGPVPQIDFIDTDNQGGTDNKDWSIHVNVGKLYFIREPWEHNDLVLDGTGKVGIGTSTPTATLEVQGNFMQRMETIRCGGRGDWGSSSHPIKVYFRQKLSGKPKGTILRAMQDHPSWRGYYWTGWVDHGGQIRVQHTWRPEGETA